MNEVKYLLPVIGLLSIAGIGCSSMGTHMHGGATKGIYPGVRASAGMTVEHARKRPEDWPIVFFILPYTAIDLPCSALLDTVLLPWDIRPEPNAPARR